MATRERARMTHREHLVVDAARIDDAVAALERSVHPRPEVDDVADPFLELLAEMHFRRFRRCSAEMADAAAFGRVGHVAERHAALTVVGLRLVLQRQPFVEGARYHARNT